MGPGVPKGTALPDSALVVVVVMVVVVVVVVVVGPWPREWLREWWSLNFSGCRLQAPKPKFWPERTW